MEIVDYLLARKKAGGSDVTIEQLSVTENGTYSEEGIAYSPVVVNVPAPENSYQLTDIPAATVSTIEDGTDLPMSSLKVGIEPVQDLHGYDHPWAGGAGKNLFDKTQTFIKDKYIDVNGAIQNTTYGWEVSDYIPLKNNTNYYISGNNVTGASAYDALYDSDKNFVRTLGYSSSNHNGAFTTDVNEFYIRICTQESVVNNVQLEVGSTATSYEPYSNICPISGWTAANVTRSGKNLFDQSSFEWEYSESQIKYVTMPIPNGTYTFSTNMPDRDTNIRDVFVFAGQVESGASSPINGVSVISPRTITVTDGHYTIASRYGSIVDDYNWQLELGSTATTYEPYSGTTYTIQFTDGTNPLTVYGGTLDVTTGELVVDRASVDMGTLSWSTASTGRHIVGKPTDIKIVPNITVMNGACSQYILVSGNASATTDSSICMLNGSLLQINDSNLNGTDAESFKTAMNGVQFVYELATPTTYHLTPTQIRTLVGNNNIWADTGDVLSGKYFKEL